MLHKLMIGRLGNQMFQYATIRAFQEKYAQNTPINLNFSLVYKEGKKEDGFHNHLGDFQIKECLIDAPIKISLLQKIYFGCYFAGYKIIKFFSKENYDLKKRNYEKKLQKILQKKGLYLFSFGYTEFKDSKTKNKLFAGHYESSQYFNDIKPILQKEFTPKEKELEENKELYKIIRNTESVCISIRRGDFLAAEHKEKHYICTPKYFEEAIKQIKEKIKNPQFVVFSDDVDWVKENMNFPKNTVYERGTDPVWEKLRLMYSCKHFIISNSTFSWWAQYLSRNENKVVIAPSRWQNVGFNDDIYEEDWDLIDIDKLTEEQD